MEVLLSEEEDEVRIQRPRAEPRYSTQLIESRALMLHANYQNGSPFSSLAGLVRHDSNGIFSA
jgi:hypothetical protein